MVTYKCGSPDEPYATETWCKYVHRYYMGKIEGTDFTITENGETYFLGYTRERSDGGQSITPLTQSAIRRANLDMEKIIKAANEREVVRL